MKYPLLIAAAASLAATPAAAQDRNPIGDILGAIFGERAESNTLDGQWGMGRTPLSNQRGAFEQRVDSDVSRGVITSATAARLKYDYYLLTQKETRYASDRRFTSQEREELKYDYNRLTQVLADGTYADGVTDAFIPANTATSASIADGRAAFEQRVNASVSARNIRRSVGTRLKAEYTALIDIESAYLRDGRLSDAEQADLEARLDALEARIGDMGYNPANMTAAARLAAIGEALPTSGLSTAAQAQLLVEHGDLVRLAQAYTRVTTNNDDREYLDARLANLETRAGLRR
ncbi:hypothetical protein [Sphingomicrobium flavum]|uniref:hypothetical protein n=1 Tax=Sphingomicrobium flavum TaxID=1229164 RepID=UPI0021AD5BF5|nr:hypothetical protein [Sphingomicrobium flavum]